jgi:hypothetical protein
MIQVFDSSRSKSSLRNGLRIVSQVLPAEEQLLKTRYIHVSANWNNPLKKQTPSCLKLFYINAPNAGEVR